jgi:hypothetical protein
MQKLMTTSRFLMLCSFVLALIVFGCSVLPDALQTLPTITPPLDATPPTARTLAVSSKPSPEPTATVTALPDTPTQTSTPLTPTPFPTRMIVPTLSPEALKKNLIELFSTNGGCDFPCWWGVSPGDFVDKAFSLSSILGEAPGRDVIGNYYYYTISIVDLHSPDLDVNFYHSPSGVIQETAVILRYPSQFHEYNDAIESQLALHNLLTQYGKPSEVLLLIKPRSEKNDHSGYALFLAYDSRGFGIEYWGIVDNEDPIRVCSIKLNNYHLYEFRFYAQDLPPVIEERSQFFLSEFRSLDQVTSMSLDDFYQAYSDANYSGCIETSYELWK